MELTLGKRIMSNRKRLGLTQDQLAEKLGVTAQAVSKWENDQSCPDITMLPKLAELFGITTDELLGRPRPEPVYDAEGEPAASDDTAENKWGHGRKSALTFGVLMLLVGILALINAIFDRGASLWELLWPSVLFVLGIRSLFSRFYFLGTGCALTGGYFLLEHMGVLRFDIGGELIVPVLLVIIGISLLVDVLRRPNTPYFAVGKRDGKPSQNDYRVNGESFTYRACFGEQKQPVTMKRLTHGDVSTSFGDYRLDLGGIEAVAEGCFLEASCSFGALTLLVPRRFRVKCDSGTAFASIETAGEPDMDPAGTILLRANASFGEIRICYT